MNQNKKKKNTLSYLSKSYLFHLSILLFSLILKETGKHNYEIDEQERENEKFFNNLRNIPAIYSKKSWEEDYQKHVRASSRPKYF